MYTELWMPIKHYEGLYEISDKGRVKSLGRWRKNGSNGYVQREKILAQTKTTTGYWKVELTKEMVRKSFKVHRLVATAFIDNELSKPNVNHKDGNPLNNCVDNLEWVTQSENCIHAIETGLKKIFKISKEELEHLYIELNLSANQIASMFDISRVPIDKYIYLYDLKKERPSEKYFLTKEFIFNQLKNKSQRKLAKEVGCSSSLINQYVKRIRKNGDIFAKQVCSNRKAM